MSQDSTGSEESLTLSEGTLSELKNLIGLDLQSLDFTQLENESTHEMSQPSCSFMNTSSLHNNVGTAGSYCHSNICSVPFSEQRDTNSRQQTIVPRPTHIPSQVASLGPVMPVIQTNNIPLDEDYPGSFKFDIDFEQQREPTPKAAAWIFSRKLNKLFAKRNTYIPMRIVSGMSPDQYAAQCLSVRVVMVYSGSGQTRDVVQRCPNHTLPPGNASEHKHIMECRNPETRYETMKTGHHSLTIPFKELEAGRNYKLEFFQFMCLNTCPGGPERRPFHVVFNLLYKGQVCGVKILKTKICTTPGRSKEKEEGKPRKVCSSTSVEPVLRKKVKLSENTSTVTSTNYEPQEHFQEREDVSRQPSVMSEDRAPLRIKQEEDDEVFTIQVRGRENYQILLRIKESLELMRYVPPEVVDRYRASCPPYGPNWLNQERSTESLSPLNSSNSTRSRYTLFMAKKKKSRLEDTKESTQVVQ